MVERQLPKLHTRVRSLLPIPAREYRDITATGCWVPASSAQTLNCTAAGRSSINLGHHRLWHRPITLPRLALNVGFMPDEPAMCRCWISDTMAQDSLSSGSPMYRFVCRSSLTPSCWSPGGSVWMEMIAMSMPSRRSSPWRASRIVLNDGDVLKDLAFLEGDEDASEAFPFRARCPSRVARPKIVVAEHEADLGLGILIEV